MFSLKYIFVPFCAAFLSQFIKVFIEYIKYKKISFIRFINGMGGMPSTHSALVASLSSIIYFDYGINSPLFAITLIFSLVVIYDSMGIRYESGEQAKVINSLTGGNLKEMIGHKPREILVGVLLGILFAFVFK